MATECAHAGSPCSAVPSITARCAVTHYVTRLECVCALFAEVYLFSSMCVSVIAQLRQHLDKWDKERTAACMAWRHRGNPSVMQHELQRLGLLEDHKRGPEGQRCKSSKSPFPWPSER
jgi:hypothetical protein